MVSVAWGGGRVLIWIWAQFGLCVSSHMEGYMARARSVFDHCGPPPPSEGAPEGARPPSSAPVQVTGRFVNGVPASLEASYVMRSTEEWAQGRAALGDIMGPWPMADGLVKGFMDRGRLGISRASSSPPK